MTRPRSFGPTRTSRRTRCRPLAPSTMTASGSSTIERTTCSRTAVAVGARTRLASSVTESSAPLLRTGGGELAPCTRYLEQLLHTLGRLGAIEQPLDDLLVVDRERRRLLARVVVP